MNSANFLNYSNNNVISLFSKVIDENQNALVKAYELQNAENYEESINYLEAVAKNFHFLGSMVDQFAYTPELIQENRELLSQAHVDMIYDKFPKYEINKNVHYRPVKKAKQHKVKWSEKEQNLFLEALDMYGVKNLKKVSDHIGSRTVGQVRSHLQKHLIKEKKKKAKIESECNGEKDDEPESHESVKDK